MTGQIPLDMPLPRRRARGRDGFLVSASNEDALRLIDGWRAWPDHRLVLVGPGGAGKTHLAHVWMEASGAEKLSAGALAPDDAPALVSAGAVCIEDVDRAAGDREAERGLFHLMNLCREASTPLLLTGKGAPNFWGVKTPDLASRLCGATLARLEAPDDHLLAGLVAKHFADRQLKVDPAVIRLLVQRSDRSAASVGATVAALDAAALAAKAKITPSFVRKTLDL